MALPREKRRHVSEEPRQQQHRLPWVYFAILLLLVLALLSVVVVVALCVDPVMMPTRPAPR